VIGSISLTSMRPNAYHQEEIQVLETMAQIVTVNIENARLYERDRQLIQEGRQREAQLAAVNSALQAISSELDVNVLLNNLVEEVAKILKVDICVFFQPSSDNTELVANALYAPTSVRMVDDGSGMPEIDSPGGDDLISMIRLPFKGTFLEYMTNEGFFYLDSPKLEELTQKSPEASAIFLSETQIKNMLMIPMSYPTEFLGFLAVPLPGENRFFRPKDVATLLAICAQATSAVRNAQLFAQREEAYAELQRLDKLKDEFMVTASHELRTPLSAISGYSTLLKRQGARATPQQIMRFATKIATASQQLSYLVANMTEAAKVGSIDKDLKIEAVQLYSAVEVAANILALDVQQEITLDIEPNLWFEGDGHRVRQVLTNLLENAAKYSPPEGRISLRLEALTNRTTLIRRPDRSRPALRTGRQTHRTCARHRPGRRHRPPGPAAHLRKIRPSPTFTHNTRARLWTWPIHLSSFHRSNGW
jgi:K+-sensing histidine kinase KdpD